MNTDKHRSVFIPVHLWFLLLSAVTATPHLSYAPATGEVTSTSAIVWGRCDGSSTLRVRLDGEKTVRSVRVEGKHDFTGRVRLDRLTPDTAYRYRVWCGDAAADSGKGGRFRTAPMPDQPAAVRFIWSGDLGGQNACRDAEKGYFIFDRMRERDPAFFVGLGDMIYADDACREIGLYRNRQVPGPGPSTASTPSFWQHWRYNREDEALQRFFAETPQFAVWDDHEISNDAGPKHDTLRNAPGQHRMPPAHAAFLDYQPIAETGVLYRKVRWGKYLEVFFLDTRSYRDLNSADDGGGKLKTMLGAKQRAWLIDSLARSTATWKVVVSSVPISVPTGDGWADGGGGKGFERELRQILGAAHGAKVENMVWITTDIHFATGFRYTPFPDDHFLEFSSGPLSAGMFPKQDLDDTFHPERLFFFGGPLPNEGKSFEEAAPFFNFGEIDIDAEGSMTVRILDSAGREVFVQTFAPAAK